MSDRTITFGDAEKNTTFIHEGHLYLKTSKNQAKTIQVGYKLSESRKFKDDELIQRTLKIEYRGYAGTTGRLRL